MLLGLEEAEHEPRKNSARFRQGGERNEIRREDEPTNLSQDKNGKITPEKKKSNF
jgi:hypothetical protein